MSRARAAQVLQQPERADADELHLHRRVAPRDLLLALTYVVVPFSILVQRLTIGAVARRAA
ncbi:hypothetical protein [Cognatilysobacter lacus]|uniref:Uncharacterized protein n=1 Tax=Cognatilysobacter lacus TaxID=1643323 RepID=A0A5D8Z7I2_9GAMM|nr:hypothetical protein [Lysobacter lacus]TZF90640.1 hypothetical protein FW784_04525 [Lysobacter lacus]